MDKTFIANIARKMKTKEDLLIVLNYLKSCEQNEELDEMTRPFTMQQLQYYCNPNHDEIRYKHFQIKKKSGGFRQITAPKRGTFRLMLHYVNEIFKALYEPSEYAKGFAEGRSVVDNALKHKGMNYVFNTDLKDFFPSIDQARVWKRLQLKPLNFPQPIANLLAGLCAMRVEEEGKFRYVLPQGAPTSPILTNMICDNLDRRLAGLARRFKLNYSRYADDITFSSQHNVYQPNGEFQKELRRIIEGQGFTMNEAKTRLQKVGSRQEVTGIIVSDKLNVTQKYVRNIRNLLYIWEKYGYEEATKRFLPHYHAEKGVSKHPNLANVLNGKILYLKMVKGEKDAVYQRLNNKFQLLDGLMNDVKFANADKGVKKPMDSKEIDDFITMLDSFIE